MSGKGLALKPNDNNSSTIGDVVGVLAPRSTSYEHLLDNEDRYEEPADHDALIVPTPLVTKQKVEPLADPFINANFSNYNNTNNSYQPITISTSEETNLLPQRQNTNSGNNNDAVIFGQPVNTTTKPSTNTPKSKILVSQCLSDAEETLIAQKKQFIAAFKKAYPCWVWPFANTHHRNRRNAVCAAIQEASNLKEIKAIIENQVKVTELFKKDAGTVTQNSPDNSLHQPASLTVETGQSSIQNLLLDRWSNASKARNRFSEKSGYVKAIKALQETVNSSNTNNV